MSTVMDHRWSMKRETTYDSTVTTDRFYPWMDGTDADWDPRPRQSESIQGGNGRRSYLGARNYLPIGRGTTTVKAALESMDLGVLLDWCFGASTVTSITGGAQQVFHPGITGTYLPSCTQQFVKVENNGTETVETYSGVTASKITIEQPKDGAATITVEGDARSYDDTVAAASASYASTPTIFDQFQGSVGVGGTLTAPTTTTLASGLTAYPNMESFKVEITQNIDTDAWTAGDRHQPVAGIPDIKFTGNARHNSTTWSDALVDGTLTPFYWTWTTTEALGAGVVKAQLVIPQMRILKGLPKPKPGDPSVQAIDAKITNDGTHEDIYLVIQTTDTAL